MNHFLSFALLYLSLTTLFSACGESGPPKPPRQPTPLDMSRVGAISGSIHFEGPVPEQSILQLGGWSECAAQYEGTVYAGDVLVTNGKLQNALVYIKHGLGDRVFTVPEQPVQNDQKGCVFLPRVMAVQVINRSVSSTATPRPTMCTDCPPILRSGISVWVSRAPHAR